MTKWLLSCEHGGNEIPSEFDSAFLPYSDLLKSHRGFDIGVADLFEVLKNSSLFDFTIINVYSRLLIDFNRSLSSKNLFSDISRLFTSETKKKLIDQFYLPYRQEVSRVLNQWLKQGFKLVHISLHSFTPELNGINRNCEAGILYDPKNSFEKEFSGLLKDKMKPLLPDWKVRFNYPYQGIDDGHTEFCRRNIENSQFQYIGVEVEVNQNLFARQVLWEKHFVEAFVTLKGELK
ncbi:MAG: N-formylglutamate amidohydrolase [Spirochaetales bacterium]|nr:N-formylglutamate amidohydrolase [Spirochaetales bacterium]